MEHPQPQDRVELFGRKVLHGRLDRERLNADGIENAGPIVLAMCSQTEKGEFGRRSSGISIGGAGPNHGGDVSPATGAAAWMAAAMPDDGYFDVSPTDRSMVILDRTSPVAFHAIWDLIGPVDLDSVKWSWQALARVHPILTCTVDIDRDETWRPGAEPTPINLTDGDGDIEQATARALAMPVDVVDGPIVRLAAITRDNGLRFVLTAHHAAFDGAASLILIDDLRTLYLAHSSARPVPVEPDRSARTVRSAVREARLSMPVVQGLITKNLDWWRRLPVSTHRDPRPMPAQTATDYVSVDLGRALSALDERRRRNSWPIDAVLVGLLEAAWGEVFGRSEVGASVWLVSSNLRPGLGITRGIGNLSGLEAIAVKKPRAQFVDQLIQQATAEIAATRSGFPGLGPELMARSWAWMPAPALNQGVNTMIKSSLQRRYTRVISNLGRIPASLSEWGPARLENLRYLGPMSRGPYCMFVAQSLGAARSLTMRTGRDWFTLDHARHLEAAINRQCGIEVAAPAMKSAHGTRTRDP